MLSDEQWETKATDKRIIRHLTKVMSIPANARMIHEAKSNTARLAKWLPISKRKSPTYGHI